MSQDASHTSQRFRSIPAGILAALVTVWAGCSGETPPTAPRAGHVETQTARSEGDTTGAVEGTVENLLAATPGNIEKIQTISSALGGTIQCGAYSVSFSPGALDEDTEIKAIDVSGARGYPCVELYPEGIEFKNTVTLQTRVPNGTPPSECRMWWWGPGRDGALRWIDIQGVVSADGLTISVNLEHFSTYAPGKAGWWKPRNPLGLPRAEEGNRP